MDKSRIDKFEGAASLVPGRAVGFSRGVRRRRRFGWLSVFVAVVGNLMLFWILGWIDRDKCPRLDAELMATGQIFPVELAAEPEMALEKMISQAQEELVEYAEPEPMEMQMIRQERMVPRMNEWIPEMPLESADLVKNAIEVAVADSITDSVKAEGSLPGGAMDVSRVDEPPKKIYGTMPSYPYWARVGSKEAVVRLSFVVDRQGRVAEVEVESVRGDNRFGQLASKAVLGWRFKPARNGGRNVKCRCRQVISFQLGS
ncbi:MAG: TonB family protein [Sedimentisphaerales bacterium]|nr:TonB family protein [Sedimentisphaerales bacterium]